MIYEEYEFEFLGVEDKNESAGDFASGSSPTTNMVADADGQLGSGEAGTERDYRDFTLAFPTIKFPGSYAFTVTMWNGISNLMYNSSWNLTNPVFHSENISLLLPGGEGYVHETGKNDDGYCIQFPNGTKILDENNKEKCYSGNSVEVVTPDNHHHYNYQNPSQSSHQHNFPSGQVNETAQYKWQFNWVEIFERLEGPFEGNLKYVLRDEAPNDRPLLDFVKPKYYLPAASHPVFELAMYKGTPRKIAYNFSNFNPDGYNPEMCYMDWPPGNLMTPCTWLSCKKRLIFD